MIREMRPIGDFCERITSGGTPSSGNASYYGGEIPWLRTQEVTFNRIHETEIKITEAGLKNSAAKWIPENSVVVAMYGASAGRVATNAIPLTTNQACCNLLVNDVSDYRYVYYALMNSFESLAGAAKGAAQNNLNAGQIREFQIPWRPLNEQSNVADVLWTIDDLIENNRRRIKLLEEAARLIYREWFVRLRFPGHEQARVENGVPNGWERVTLGAIADVVMGQSPDSKFYNEVGAGLPFHQGVKDFGLRYPTTRMYCDGPGRVAEEGDILVSVRAPVGRLNYANSRMVIGRGLSAVRSRTGSQSFLFQLLKAFFFKEDIIGSGAIYAAVTRSEFLGIELLNPPSKVVEEFCSIVDPIERQIRTLGETNERLERARDLLLPRLMSGEIEV
jgi:type I restriction enzyme S subunit